MPEANKSLLLASMLVAALGAGCQGEITRPETRQEPPAVPQPQEQKAPTPPKEPPAQASGVRIAPALPEPAALKNMNKLSRVELQRQVEAERSHLKTRMSRDEARSKVEKELGRRRSAQNLTAPHKLTREPKKQTPNKERVYFKPGAELRDPAGPAFTLLQRPASALKNLPLDDYGQVDFARALREGYIAPRKGLSPKATMQSRSNDIIMKNTAAMPWVRFPHSTHTQWLACSNCHPKPFKEQKGAHKILMQDIMAGHYCGQCHDRVAFSIMACERCHSVLQPGQKKWW